MAFVHMVVPFGPNPVWSGNVDALTHLHRVDSSTTNSLDQSISNSRLFGQFLLLLCFLEIPVYNANSVDPDQMPHVAATDLGLHCLPITLMGVS